jgi:hypothetical protein
MRSAGPSGWAGAFPGSERTAYTIAPEISQSNDAGFIHMIVDRENTLGRTVLTPLPAARHHTPGGGWETWDNWAWEERS